MRSKTLYPKKMTVNFYIKNESNKTVRLDEDVEFDFVPPIEIGWEDDLYCILREWLEENCDISKGESPANSDWYITEGDPNDFI